MKKLLFPDYQTISESAADWIFKRVAEKPELTICLATGSTPTGTYEALAARAKGNERLFAKCRVLKLDEWGGIPENHPASCQYYIQKYFLDPLSIPKSQFISFKADAADPEKECKRVKEQIAELSPIDLAVLGLGLNGHLGFNEPASALTPYAHIAELSIETQKHQMVEGLNVKPAFGYTMGMAELLQVRKIIMLVSGEHKREQQEKLLHGKADPQFPASFLCLHPDVDLYTDLP